MCIIGCIEETATDRGQSVAGLEMAKSATERPKA